MTLRANTTQVKNRMEKMLRLLNRAFATNRALAILSATMLITFLATVVGIFVDHRVITGAPAWLKPAKFAISVSVYCFTFVWLLSFVENRRAFSSDCGQRHGRQYHGRDDCHHYSGRAWNNQPL